jgi:hypothetical protein
MRYGSGQLAESCSSLALPLEDEVLERSFHPFDDLVEACGSGELEVVSEARTQRHLLCTLAAFYEALGSLQNVADALFEVELQQSLSIAEDQRLRRSVRVPDPAQHEVQWAAVGELFHYVIEPFVRLLRRRLQDSHRCSDRLTSGLEVLKRLRQDRRRLAEQDNCCRRAAGLDGQALGPVDQDGVKVLPTSTRS